MILIEKFFDHGFWEFLSLSGMVGSVGKISYQVSLGKFGALAYNAVASAPTMSRGNFCKKKRLRVEVSVVIVNGKSCQNCADGKKWDTDQRKEDCPSESNYDRPCGNQLQNFHTLHFFLLPLGASLLYQKKRLLSRGNFCKKNANKFYFFF